jgi:hypothetical protein
MINKQSERRTQHWWVWIHAIEDVNTRSDEISTAYRMKAKYKQVEKDSQINIWSHISWVSYYIQWCCKIKKWFYVNVHDTAIKLQCKKMTQNQRNMMKQSQVQFFIIFSTEDTLTSLELCHLWRMRSQKISISISQISQNSYNTDQLWSQL